MELFKDRLLHLVRHYGITIAELSKKLGYARDEKLRRLINGKSLSPSMDVLNDLIKTFPELNPLWLISGDGKMILDDQKVPDFTINNISSTQIDKIPLLEIELQETKHKLELAEEKVRQLEARLKDKEELIELMKRK